MRDKLEFFPVEELPWEADGPIEQRVLRRDDDGVTLTRQTRWPAGHDTTAGGVIRHQFHEEVYLLEGDLTDLRSADLRSGGLRLPPARDASRSLPHRSGCVMLEIRTTGAW